MKSFFTSPYFLLFAICLFAFHITGCTVHGYVIGRSADMKRITRASVDLEEKTPQFFKGEHVLVTLKNGDSYRGDVKEIKQERFLTLRIVKKKVISMKQSVGSQFKIEVNEKIILNEEIKITSAEEHTDSSKTTQISGYVTIIWSDIRSVTVINTPIWRTFVGTTIGIVVDGAIVLAVWFLYTWSQAMGAISSTS